MVGILFGSRSDADVMRGASRALDELEVKWEAHVLSAHRVPDELSKRIRQMESDGVKVFICGAGLAAHLPGVVASQTLRPVIGVPVAAQLGGNDALYSIVQMPKPIPVACVGINNAFNAGMLAAEILATGDEALAGRIEAWRASMREHFIQDNESGEAL